MNLNDLDFMKDEADFNQIKEKSFLVTGAGGLLGSTFIDLLMRIDREAKANIVIYALGRNKQAMEHRFVDYLNNPNFHIILADVTNFMPDDLLVDYILHAASPAHPLAYSLTPVEVMKANLLGTVNILDLAKKCQARVLFVSSGEIYGISENDECIFSESDAGYIDILNARSCYPESKRAAETLCASYFFEYQVYAMVVRLCHVYGASIIEKNSRADAQFLRNVLNGEDIVMKSAGSQVRSYCYVEDAAAALFCVLLKGQAGEAYNVANKQSIATIREYAEILANIGGVNIRNDFPTDTEYNGYTKVCRSVLDSTKLENLGWQAHYNLFQGLQKTYSLCQKMI